MNGNQFLNRKRRRRLIKIRISEKLKKKYRKKQKIIKNAAKCLKCGDIIESTHRHDFKFCSCGSIFVDGGKEYLRRGGELNDIEDMSEYEEEYFCDNKQ